MALCLLLFFIAIESTTQLEYGEETKKDMKNIRKRGEVILTVLLKSSGRYIYQCFYPVYIINHHKV